MKRALFPIIPVFLGIFTFSLPTGAQSYRELISNDKDIASYIYHPYKSAGGTLTASPSGYKPFYISHYGRHGSRYHTGESYFRAGVAVLTQADSAGLLTSEGKALKEDFMKIYNEHKGMFGQLSPLGAREHRGIATRMALNYPKVFKKRHEVASVSSPIQRCIISMANFTSALKDAAPKTKLSFVTGDRYFEYICHEITDKRVYDSSKAMEDSLRNAICTYDDLFAKIFNDRDKAMALVRNPQAFIKSVYMAGCICPCLDWMGVDIFKYLTVDELASQATVRNNKFYGEYGGSTEWGEDSKNAAHDLLKDFITKADEALKPGSDRAADLRFGHDTGIIPLVSLIGMEGMDSYPMAKASQMGWYCHDKVPMGSNFQMIFYRNAKGDILVKMLYNEKETTVKAVPTFKGPYYRWSDLRDYFVRISNP